MAVPEADAVDGDHVSSGPFGDQLNVFLDWVQSPHSAYDGTAKRYDVKSPHELGLGTKVCGPDQFYMPINLPSDLDVQIRVGRRDGAGNELPEQVIDLKRTSACKTVPGATEGEEALGPYGPTASPFAHMFNDSTFTNFQKLFVPTRNDREILKATFAFHQQMEAGRRIRFRPDQVVDAYNTPETRRPVLETDPSSDPVTSIYWLLGLMVRLGTQKDLASLQQIDRLDIALRDSGPDDYAFIPFPDTQGGQENAYDYFQKVGVGFAHTLTSELVRHEDRIYVAPGFRSFQRINTPLPVGTTLWSLRSAGPQASGALAGDDAKYGGLARLAAIELRGVLPPDQNPPLPLPDIGDSLSVVPGLYVTGKLKRYRRFPDVSGVAGAKLLGTVMTFEPDPAMALELAKLRDALGDAGLRPLLTAPPINGWTLTLLNSQPLPWDGPNPVFRMLATSTSTARTVGSLVCNESTAAFFLPALPTALTLRKVGLRHIWDPQHWGNAASSSALTLEQRWSTEAPAWKEVRFNALQVTGIFDAAKDNATAHTMMIDAFDLHPAESPLALEKVLAVTALSPRMAALAGLPDPDPRNFDPLRDYEDDFISFNTVRLWHPDPAQAGKEVLLNEALLRSPQQTEANPQQCRVGDAQRRQTIPLLASWPVEPLDLPAASAPTQVSWQMVRDEVSRRYDLKDELDKGPYRIELEHTYGDRIALAASDGSPLRFNRSPRRGWPVALPTFVETQDNALRFIQVQYVAGMGSGRVDLVFDTSFLVFPNLTADAARSDKRYALALSAWRAVAELASPGATIALNIYPANFDIFNALAVAGVDPAQVAAERGLLGGWASGVAKGTMTPVSGADLAAIQSWAKSLIGGAAPAPAPLPFHIPLGPGVKPSEAHLLRIDFQIVRDVAQAPVSASNQVLAPINQQAGLFRVAPDTMQAAWAKLGFGVDLGAIDAPSAGPVWDALNDARDRWTSERTDYADSISPIVQSGPNRQSGGEVHAALMTALEGSDWFAPAGTGPRAGQLAIEPILVPVGFAPCRPHATLKQATQEALQRVMTALRDTIDLAFVSWTSSESEWQNRFDAIAGLVREATRTQSAGLLTGLVDLLVDRLFYAEPDPVAPANAQPIRDVATAINSASAGDFAWFKAAIRRRLLADPALFTDAKALLLSVMHFVEDTSLAPQPPPTALARARFNRLGIDPDNPAKQTSTTLTLDDLVFAGKVSGAPTEERLAFLETLDDARYGDEFELAPSPGGVGTVDFAVDSYEQLIDPQSGDGWPKRPAVLPLAAANDGRTRRVVHLASRALLAPPVLRFTGESAALDEALAAGAADWSVEQLERGLPGMPAAGGTRLRIAGAAHKPAIGATIERGVSFILYRVTGDEERPSVFEQAFENDSFFLRLGDSEYAQRAQPKVVLAANGGTAGSTLRCEPLLRDLLFAGRGSDAAATAIQLLALGADDYSSDFAQLVAVGDAQLPDKTFALIRLSKQGASWALDVAGPDAQQTIARIRHVVLFKPDNASASDAARIAYLLVGFETSVWSPIEAELSQGRNVPQDQWGGAAASLDKPRFASQFWQSVAQDAPASHHSLARRVASNEPRHWRVRPTHVVTLDTSWRQPKTPRQLLEKLLFERGHVIGNQQTSPSVLAPGSSVHIFDQQLSVQIFQEQFDQDPTAYAEPLGNFPLEQNLLCPRLAPLPTGKIRPPKDELGPMIWFDPFYDQFSVSFRWFAPSGAELLTLDRIFVAFA